MTDNQTKVPFASPQWVEIARVVLERLVAEHGEEGTRYSVCEAFAEAPRAISDDNGFAAWSFFVDGKSVSVHVGRDDSADIQIQATWETSLEGARTVYTPEYLAEREKNPPPPPDDPNLKVSGDMTAIPRYLVELHNDMAVLTE